jgi:glycosyltransferase involved in cell wall biosynthesis
MVNKSNNSRLLSVIIPVYNGADKVSNCLDSIYSQNLDEEKFEVICVDDCSTDNTYSVIDNYLKGHINLRLLTHEINSRQGAARNTGLKVAKGKYVIFVDHDDRAVHIPELISFIETNDYDVIMFDYSLCDVRGKVIEVSHYNCNSPYELQTGDNYLKTQNISWAPWSYCVKLDYIKKCNLYFAENVFFEDVDWAIKCVMNANSIVYIPEVIVHYYQYPQQTTKVGNNIKKIEDDFKCCERIQKLAINAKDLVVKDVILSHACYLYRNILRRFLWRLGYHERLNFFISYQLSFPSNYKESLMPFVAKYPKLSSFLMSLAKPGLYVVYQIKQVLKEIR